MSRSHQRRRTTLCRFCSTALRASQCRLSRCRTSLSTRPMRACRAGLDHAAGEHRLHRVDRTGLPDRAAGAAEAGENAEIDLGEAEPRLVVVDRDPVVAGERQLEPAAEAEAVDRRDRPAPSDSSMRSITACVRRSASGRIDGSGHRVEFADVGAGDEARVLARLDDEPDRPRRSRSGPRPASAPSRARLMREPAQRVDRALRACRSSASRCFRRRPRSANWSWRAFAAGALAVLLFRGASLGPLAARRVSCCGGKLVGIEIVDLDDAVGGLVGEPQERGLGFGQHAAHRRHR